MKVIDLDDEYKQSYFLCLEDWSVEMKEAGNHKEIWYNKMKEQGLGVKLARDDNGNIGAMIQNLERSQSTHSSMDGVSCPEYDF